MATLVSEVYDSFLTNISDYRLATSSEVDIEETLKRYLKKAKSKFPQMSRKLNIEVNNESEEYFCEIIKNKNNESEIIPTTLSDLEVEIISTLMTVEYLRPQVLSTKILSQHLSDKDFKINSQANHLKELNLLYRQLKKESAIMLTKYSYQKLIEENE